MKNVLYESKPLKPKNLKNMFRKSPTRNAWAAIFKNAKVSKSTFKVTKLSKF